MTHEAMTKDELIEALEPFDGHVEIYILDKDDYDYVTPEAVRWYSKLDGKGTSGVVIE
jgi:hypothetical protein